MSGIEWRKCDEKFERVPTRGLMDVTRESRSVFSTWHATAVCGTNLLLVVNVRQVSHNNNKYLNTKNKHDPKHNTSS